jgi:predicted nucleotidyltransferase
MLLFGSLVRGIPTPRSDADILVILKASEIERPRDRVPQVLAAMSPLPCPVDLFVWTAEELQHAAKAAMPLAREALEHGVDLLA